LPCLVELRSREIESCHLFGKTRRSLLRFVWQEDLIAAVYSILTLNISSSARAPATTGTNSDVIPLLEDPWQRNQLCHGCLLSSHQPVGLDRCKIFLFTKCLESPREYSRLNSLHNVWKLHQAPSRLNSLHNVWKVRQAPSRLNLLHNVWKIHQAPSRLNSLHNVWKVHQPPSRLISRSPGRTGSRSEPQFMFRVNVLYRFAFNVVVWVQCALPLRIDVADGGTTSRLILIDNLPLHIDIVNSETTQRLILIDSLPLRIDVVDGGTT
jgi:hypothetical protein